MSEHKQAYEWLRHFPKHADFDPTNDPIDYAFIDRMVPHIEGFAKYFRTSFEGLDRIPRSGPVVLVGNHGVMAFDALFMFAAVYRATGRMPRGLGDHILFTLPSMARLFRRWGVQQGTRKAGLRLLEAGQIVAVYPGGARDALKGSEALYRLPWDKSHGFVRLAMEARAPIVLCMGIGIDETYRVLGKVRFTGRILGHSKYEIPLWLGWGPMPRPVKLTYYISQPIWLEGGPAEAQSAAMVARHHERVWRIAQSLLDSGLRKRHSIWFG